MQAALKDKVAVIYGGGGAIGSEVARTFAGQGATVFLAGRRQARLDPVVEQIRLAGGAAEAALVDALDENAVDRHLRAVTDKAGRVDISFNAIGIPNTTLQGVPLTELSLDQFLLPITTYARSNFVTARMAGRRMVEQGSGVILTVTAVPSRTGIPLVGGLGPAMASVESLTRSLSAEFASKGVRVVGLRPDGMPDSGTIKEVFGIHAKAYGMGQEEFHDLIAGKNHRRRLASLAELAQVAAFVASDAASPMTGTIVNLSMGLLDD